MNSVTKSAETPVGKASGAEVIRAAGEEHRPRLLGGSCTEMSVLKILVSRNPGQKLEDPRYTAEDIREAARSMAHCWMEVGELSEEMRRFKGHAGELRQKAEVLMNTYGLSAEEVARSSSLPPEPGK